MKPQFSSSCVDIGDRKLSSEDMATKVRDILKNHPPISSYRLSPRPGWEAAGRECPTSSTFLQGPDLKKLGEYSDKLIAQAKTIPGLGDLDSSLRTGKPEVSLDIDRSRAADLGVSVQDIQQALNTLVAGQTASTFSAGDDQYDVVVRAEDRFRGSTGGLGKADCGIHQERIGWLERGRAQPHQLRGHLPSSGSTGNVSSKSQATF